MLTKARQMIQALGLALGLVLALAFAAPSLASEVCDDACFQAEQTVAASNVGSGPAPACPDCGPACANGCCHAPHPAVAPDAIAPVPTAPAIARIAWDHASLPAPAPDLGLERPPRA